MFSVSRFLMTGKVGLKGLSKAMRSDFFKLKCNSFAAKGKDPSSEGVDKSKRSVSGGGATASDSEKREPSQQTMKVAKPAAKPAEQPAQKPQQTQTTQQAEQTQQTQQAQQSTPQVKVIKTVPGHRPPTSEDTVAGRYSNTLFVVASEENNLYNVYEDMKYLINLYEKVESFRIFADNSGLNAAQIYSFSEELAKCGEFSATTLKFLDLLGKNKRFMYINEIAKKYIRVYLMLTKEEKITIISAQPLTDEEKGDVKKALSENPENEGKTFIIDYSVNPSIVGGLQMYTENKFMDLSLSSRLDRIKDEVNKLI